MSREHCTHQNRTQKKTAMRKQGFSILIIFDSQKYNVGFQNIAWIYFIVIVKRLYLLTMQLGFPTLADDSEICIWPICGTSSSYTLTRPR